MRELPQPLPAKSYKTDAMQAEANKSTEMDRHRALLRDLLSVYKTNGQTPKSGALKN